MDRKQIKKVVRKYLADLQSKIAVDKAILFGSAVRGKIYKNSDIDLLILSPAFKGMDTVARFDLLYEARKSFLTQTVPMDLFALTPDEYARASDLSLVGEIKKKGKVINFVP